MDGSHLDPLDVPTAVDNLQQPMRNKDRQLSTNSSNLRVPCDVKNRIPASFYADNGLRCTRHPPLASPCLGVWCYPVCCIMTKYSPPPHQENKRKLNYDRSAAQFISNPPRCRSNFNLLVPQTGRRSQSINSPWSVLEGVKWSWCWGGRRKDSLVTQEKKKRGLSLPCALSITHFISL